VITKTSEPFKRRLRTKEVTEKNDVATTVIVNWRQFRVGPKPLKANEELTEKLWLASIDDMETCRIRSKPDQGASISIDGLPHTATTNTVVGLRSDNTYKIRLKKGTKSAEGELKVEKGGNNTFTGDLK
jgi:hypothetical protein